MCATSSPQEQFSTSLDILPLAGRPLAFARAGWVGVVAICLALFIASLPQRLAELSTLVSATFPQAQAHTLPHAMYVGCAFALELLGPLVFVTLAILVLLRRNDSGAAIRISALLLAFGTSLPGVTYAILSGVPIWRITPGLQQIIGWTALLIFAFLFPDGRWIPRWSRFVVPLWMLWTVSFFIFGERILAGRPAMIAVSYLVWILWLGTGVCAQFYRYTRVATPPERQQTKWVMLGFVAALVGILVASVQHIIALSLRRPFQSSAAFVVVALVVMAVSALPIPISIAIAILRHNLYDIDRLINLTIVYSALTVALGLIYAAAVGLTQILVQFVTGRQGEPQLALVVSTLGAAALFQPLRRRIQIAIDRRFYRKNYNATKAVEAFAASLRTELDLNELTQRLIDVTHRTMAPKHVSLWLAQPRTARQPSEPTSPDAAL